MLPPPGSVREHRAKLSMYDRSIWNDGRGKQPLSNSIFVDAQIGRKRCRRLKPRERERVAKGEWGRRFACPCFAPVSLWHRMKIASFFLFFFFFSVSGELFFQ